MFPLSPILSLSVMLLPISLARHQNGVLVSVESAHGEQPPRPGNRKVTSPVIGKQPTNPGQLDLTTHALQISALQRRPLFTFSISLLPRKMLHGGLDSRDTLYLYLPVPSLSLYDAPTLPMRLPGSAQQSHKRRTEPIIPPLWCKPVFSFCRSVFPHRATRY